MDRTVGEYLETDTLTPAHWLAILLVLLTGVIHVYAGFVEGRVPVSLAGVGFLGAAALFLSGYRRPLLYPAGIAYTAVQLPLWYVANAGEYTTVGYVDKTIQVALVLVLAYLYWRRRETADPGEDSPAA